MRVNVYAEEMTDRVEVISKTTEDGEFTGLRIYLELPCTVPDPQEQFGSATMNMRGPFIHRPGDDDSAAVTFWGKRDLRDVLLKAIAALDAHHAGKSAPHCPPADDSNFGSDRAPHLDMHCAGGNHYTLGYYRPDSADRDRTSFHSCPNKECKLYGKELA